MEKSYDQIEKDICERSATKETMNIETVPSMCKMKISQMTKTPGSKQIWPEYFVWTLSTASGSSFQISQWANMRRWSKTSWTAFSENWMSGKYNASCKNCIKRHAFYLSKKKPLTEESMHQRSMNYHFIDYGKERDDLLMERDVCYWHTIQGLFVLIAKCGL